MGQFSMEIMTPTGSRLGGNQQRHLGVSWQTVNALERGRYDLSLPLAFGIAKLSGLPIGGIFQPDP
ncbi:transcriptional regulator [Cereibacter sp. SYSU M97828]|nr:transcriptional regulator [Cereibacter flavus]